MAGTAQQKHVMIVDDEEDTRILLKTYFVSKGYRVSLAADGHECLRMIAANITDLPDCMLLDVMMPKLNGVDVARKLKGNDKTKFIPIVMVTALSDKKYSRAALLELRVDYYVTKPYDFDDVLDKVKSAIKYRVVEGTQD